MKGSIFVTALVGLCLSSETLAAVSFSTLTPIHPALYAIPALALLGLALGVVASNRRGLNRFGAALGGLFLGPLAFLLFFVPSRRAPAVSEASCPACGATLIAEGAPCGSCAAVKAQEHARLREQEMEAERARSQARPRRRKAPDKGGAPSRDDLSSEFAQYSEMLRRTLPGALDRPAAIDYAGRFAAEDVDRCSNPMCGRLVPPESTKCPHCGMVQRALAR